MKIGEFKELYEKAYNKDLPTHETDLYEFARVLYRHVHEFIELWEECEKYTSAYFCDIATGKVDRHGIRQVLEKLEAR